VTDVALAATLGAVDTVFVDIDEVLPGTVDEATGAVTFNAADDGDSYGVVDEVARRVWLNGGRVLAVRRPAFSPAAFSRSLWTVYSLWRKKPSKATTGGVRKPLLLQCRTHC
jgi:hypothetical protein